MDFYNPSEEMTADRAQREAYGRMTPAQKLDELTKMRTLAMDLKRAGLRLRHPDWNSEQLESELKMIFLYATT